MKSNLSKILPKLQEKYPDVDVSFLLKHYFEIAKQEVELFSKPEIAFPWGTLIIRPLKLKKEIERIDFVEKEFYKDNPYDLKRKRLTELQIERNELKRLLEVHTQYKTKGKIKRNFKRDGRQYKKDKVQKQD